MPCLAIVANLCFYAVTTIAFDPPSTIMTSATAQIGRATVRLVLSSDNFVDYDPASMAHACKSGRCISYHRWCSDGAGDVKCTFTLGDSHYVEPLTISAPDQATMTEAIRAVGLIVAKHPAAIIPLALLDQQARDEYASICRSRAYTPTCRAAYGPQ